MPCETWSEVMKVRVLCKLTIRALLLVLGVTWDPALCISGQKSPFAVLPP